MPIAQIMGEPRGLSERAVDHDDQPINQASGGDSAVVAKLDANLNELIQHGNDLHKKHSARNALTQLRILVNTTLVTHSFPAKNTNYIDVIDGAARSLFRAVVTAIYQLLMLRSRPLNWAIILPHVFERSPTIIPPDPMSPTPSDTLVIAPNPSSLEK